MEDKDRYPIGQQDFRTLRLDNAFYIDKTRFVERIARSKSKYYFLARPRRFGKSLFLSTLKYFFQGCRELFNGLYIDSSEWDWQPYPVLHLDLNTDRFSDRIALDDALETLFIDWERLYGVTDIMETYSQRFKNIIKKAHAATGRQVVILVDEYDKPLVSNLNRHDDLELYRSKLTSLYSNFKSSAEHIRLVFLTGVSRFSKLSVFSDLNNLNDITFDDEFADICGITEQELLDNLSDGIHALAAKRHEDYADACRVLKQNYDGYRFAPEGSEIYNPWSVFNCLQKSRIGSYWNATGTTSLVAESLRDADIDIRKTLNAEWDLDDLAGLDLLNADPTALLYQAGYLTIAGYHLHSNTVRLKVPNMEVRNGLFKDLLNAYLKPKKDTVKNIIDGIMKSVESGQPEELMRNLVAYFAAIPYEMKIQNENNFHNVFYILTTLIGINAKAEVHTSDGRIDLLIETRDFIYIIELKYDSSPAEALRQIKEKEYPLRFSADHRIIYEIGVNFSSRKRRIDSWEINQ